MPILERGISGLSFRVKILCGIGQRVVKVTERNICQVVCRFHVINSVEINTFVECICPDACSAVSNTNAHKAIAVVERVSPNECNCGDISIAFLMIARRRCSLYFVSQIWVTGIIRTEDIKRPDFIVPAESIIHQRGMFVK